MLQVFAWWLLIEALGVVALPVLFVVLPGLPDRGLGLCKIAGLLLLGYAAWLLAMLQFVDFTRPVSVALLALLAAGSGWLARRSWPELRAFLLANRGLAVRYELLFLAGFAFMVWFRGFNPEIAGTEKPMDFALINGILRSGQFPPNDPWMSGFSISYYYFGYLQAALLIQLSGATPAVGFNLALATVFGLTAEGLAALGYNLIGRLRYGLLAAFFTLLASNPDGFLRVLRYGTLAPQQFWWWWPSSRVLHSGCGAECIDEFPQFSFMLGDLHPHVMALPAAVLALGVALGMLRRPVALRWAWEDGLPLALTPVFAGALGFINTWDLPLYLGLIIACLLLRQYLAWRQPLAPEAGAPPAEGPVRSRFEWRPAAFVGVTSFVAYLPFYSGFHSQAGGLARVAAQTQPAEFLGMWGFLFALALALLLAVVRLPFGHLTTLALLGAALLVAGRKWLPALLLPLAVAALAHVFLRLRERKWDAAQAFALGLIAAAFGLIALCEVLFLKDTFNNRMNTIFKFYYEAWLLLSVAGAYGAAQVAQRMRAAPRPALAGGLGLLCAASVLYPVASFYTKANELKPAWTLDGSAFMQASAPGDRAAIQWLNRQVPGHPVVAEATGDEYSQFGRVATYTGLPTILGWAGHELQWRGVWREQPLRIADLTTLYTSPDQATVKNLLAKYDVSYVVVGGLERQKYGNRDFSLFQKLGRVVFNQDGTTLYYVGAKSGSNS